MYNQKMYGYGTKRSVIRELFEYGNQRKQLIGDDKVFDFSLGNPNVAAPSAIKDTIAMLNAADDTVSLHSYTSAPGDISVRKAIADKLNRDYNVGIAPNHIYMTVGAAAALTISFLALNEGQDEFVAFAPFFPEYSVFVANAGAKLKVVPPSVDFQLNISALEDAITPKTKGVIVNSPNNPSGVVYTLDNILALTALLEKKQKEYNKDIYIISDEPYREIVYGGITLPYLMNYYNNTIISYSYSKSLSLPGERIGYLAVNPKMSDVSNVYLALCGAARSLGFVCAPSLMQKVIARNVDITSDMSFYTKNRDYLYNNLSAMGYDCVRPDGAFYLFVKALESDANAFSERAKQHELLLVPSDDFGVTGYVRISYCVSYKQIVDSMPSFAALMAEYR